MQKLQFSFRRKAQVRTYLLFIFIKSVPCKGDTTRGKRKLKQGQKTAFPFPLMVSPLHTSSLNPYSLPFFIPLCFACRRRPNPFHLFALFSIAMFSGLGFTPFLCLLFFGSFEGNFIKVSFLLCYRILRITSSICCLFCLVLRCGGDWLNCPLYFEFPYDFLFYHCTATATRWLCPQWTS